MLALTPIVAGAAVCSGLRQLCLNLPRSHLMAQTCCCLAALPKGLQHLSIATSGVGQVPDGWLAAFTNLRRLALRAAGGPLYWLPAAAGWAPPGLQQLVLDDGAARTLMSAAGAPASVTKLCLTRVPGDELPHQVSATPAEQNAGAPARPNLSPATGGARAWRWADPEKCSLRLALS